MERVGKVLLTAFVLLCASFARFAHAENFSNFHSGDNYHLYENSSVAAGALVEFDNLFIDNQMLLQNYGEISSKIFISNGTELQFQNSGVFSGEIIFGDNSRLVQIIQTPDDINSVGILNPGNWSVLVQGGGHFLSLSEIKSFSSGADKIILDGATLTLGYSENTSVPIEIKNEVWIDLGNTQISDGMVLISGVSGEGSVNVLSPEIGYLYYLNTRKVGDDLILYFSRETDYEKIMGNRNARGAFINRMRVGGNNRSLLGALDSQMTMSGLSNVISNSAVFNPIKLMQPVSAFVRQSLVPNFENEMPKTLMDVSPIYIFGSGINLLAGQINLGLPLENLIIGVHVNKGNFSVSDNFDNFTGTFIGSALTVDWNAKSLWMHSALGYSESRFDTDEIFAGTATPVTNPTGKMSYFSADTGMNFYKDDFYFSPFAGIGANRKKILFQSKTSVYAEMGAWAGIKTQLLGLQYDYGIFASAGTDSFYSFGAKIGIWSVTDEAGVDVEAGIMQFDVGPMYKLSANMKFNF